jgi:cyanophycin synthetase
MLRLGYGRHRRLVCAALTEQTSVIGVDIAADKMLAKLLLTDAGIPVPEGVVAWSAEEATAALDQLGGPAVVKPRTGSQGVNVIIGVTTAADAAAAYARATDDGGGADQGGADRGGGNRGGVIVERFVPGTDYRVLVVDGRVVAAAELSPASVTGDGNRDISELVAQVNADPRRGDGHSRALTRISLDDRAIGHLAAQGLDAHSVPERGRVVTLRRNANLSTGGTSRDVTDRVHDDVADMCCRAAAVVGLDVCGIDVRLPDIAAPLHGSDQGSVVAGSVMAGSVVAGPVAAGSVAARSVAAGAVIEVNACPGLRMHQAPAEGTPRDVAGAIIDSLYPPGAPSRIPVIAVTGTNGKTTTVRMIGHILRQAGLRVGMSTTDGVYSGGRLVYDADASGPRSAEMVLDDTSVEAAVLETARGGIIRRGLGYDKADVAVITNIADDHLGMDGVDDLDELISVKALIAEEIRDGGTIVLNADDPAVAAIADRGRVRRHGPVIRYFSLDAGNPVTERHRRSGGITCELRGGQLVEFDGASQRPLLSLAELPGAYGGLAPHVVANALAAVAACRGNGVSAKDVRRALATFSPGESNPGRGNVYLAAGGPVIVDYGHNTAAVDATGRMISNVWGGRPAAAITLPGDRRDDLIIRTAEAIAAWFGRVIVYEDADKRGRAPGEMTDIITMAMRRVRPDITCAAAGGPQEALRAAVAMADGQPVLFLYEKLAMAQAALDAIGARPSPADGQAGPEIPAGSAATSENPARPAGPEFAGRPTGASDIAARAAGPEFAGRPAGAAGTVAPALQPVAADVPASAAAKGAAPTAAQAAPAARAGTAVSSPAPLGMPELAAEAEQVVPRLTAAAERVAPPAALADGATSAAGLLRRADRPVQWNRGHW